MASQLKRQLLAMNAKMETNSASPKGVTKKGGSARFHEPDKTGADRTVGFQSSSKKAPTGKKVQVNFKPQPTGKATPKGKNPGSGPAKMRGRNGSLWGQ